MASVRDRADSIIKELLMQSQEIAPPNSSLSTWWYKYVYNLCENMERFEIEFRCLRIFLDCIYKWSNFADVFQLDSLVHRIEFLIEKIGNKLIENVQLPLGSPRHVGSPISLIPWMIENISLQRKVSKLDGLFAGLIQDVTALKPVISEAYACWTTECFQFRFDCDQWEEFSELLISYRKACRKLAKYYDESHISKQFEDLNRYLVPAKDLLDCLLENSSGDLKIEVMIQVGSVGVMAALALCEWWVGKMDRDKQHVLRVSVLELQKKIDPTNTKFVDLSLKLLRENGNRVENQGDDFLFPVDVFIKYLSPLLVDFARYLNLLTPSILWELEFLVTSLINFPREEEENVEMLLGDVKLMLNAMAKLKNPYKFRSIWPFDDHVKDVKDQNMLQNVLAEIWLIKLEIFLRKQLNHYNILQKHMKKEINALSEGLRQLNYEEWLKSLNLKIEHSPNAERVQQVLVLAEEVGEVVACLDHSFYAEELTTCINEMVRIFKLLLMIVLFKAESSVKSFLYNDDQGVMILDKNQIEALYNGLEFFIMFVKDQPADYVEEAKLIFANIEEVACGMRSLVHSLPSCGIRKRTLKNVNLLVSGLLEKIMPIMGELKVYVRPDFPKTNGLGFIDSLLEKLEELLNTELSASQKHQIEEIMGDIEFLTTFLRNIQEHDIQLQELKDLHGHVIDVAYEAERYIDSMMLDDSVEWHNLLWLYHLQKDIRLVMTNLATTYNKIPHAKEQDMPLILVQKETVEKLFEEPFKGGVISEPTFSTQTEAKTSIGESIVSLCDQEKLIIDRLVAGPDQLDIVPIVGLPGIGKTTLAKQVYNCPEVVSSFHIRTWCCISQVYRKREVLLEILSHITELSDDILGMTDEDLEDKLRTLLLKNKFLIVMDDMWNSEALSDLRGSLPNDGNGSRILITSRQDLKADTYANPHCLRLLSDAESWNLLQKKIFHEEGCPKELMETGKEIAKSCRGLPLAIVAVAGLLQKRKRQYNSWKEIERDLSFRIVDDPQEQCRQILELSYKNLPDYLKVCFLYLAAFSEDQDIPARKLMRLWIAEGFVQKNEFKSLEDVAEDYLTDLIGRSLVIFSQRRSKGGAKACRVHDVLQRFCQSKAKEDKFLTIVTRSDDSKAPLHDFYHVFNAKPGNHSSSTTYDDHRLCFFSKRKHFIESKPAGSRVRSLLFFATNDKDPRRPYDISDITCNFRLLKVLDLECINMGTSFPKGIERLVQLRYLAVSGYLDSIPCSIACLRNLETLIVRGLGDAVNITGAIWCLKKLRHVHVSDFAIISLQDEDGQHGDSSGLDHLVTVSSLFLLFGKESEYILRKISNVRKLKCIFSESWDNLQNCNNFPSLKVLNHIESLKIIYYGQILQPGEFIFPSNLKKLTLSSFHLPWDKMSVIGQLPNLEVLKLLSGAFDGKNWDMVEGEFAELKYLKLDNLNIVKWNAYSDQLPKLQQLVLRCCRQLEEVPLGVAYIPTLEKVDVQWCGDHVEESVRRIKEEGDENLKVFINFAELHIA
ncbi:hypothetical protein M9H77_09494 [Catharanthus roseus]|uniref:Uncharacterized protein n=1 Tax=Catharanthus roseus TaxID=4058 RepID=A0ACC0C0R5_CATRO|nr:hypothetical protein M9H77_09494 [Catharanthus roseus]